jgi:hypothetical protein
VVLSEGKRRESIAWNLFDQKEELPMKKKIFFALIGMAVLVALSSAAYMRA